MKKYLKSLAKKSMSLCLAVIMLLSCWVWVAPERAEAANSPEEGYYYVEVRGRLDDWAEDNEVGKNVWTIKHSNGETVINSRSVSNNSSVDNSGNFVHASGWVKGFPTGIRHEFARAQKDDGCGGTEPAGNGWGVRDADLWVGNGKDILVQITEDTTDHGYTAQDGTYNDGEILGAFKQNITPYAKDFVVSGDIKIELTIPKIDAGTEVSHTAPVASTIDQYGVTIGSPDGYFVSTSSDGSAECTKDKESDGYYGIWYDENSKKIVANEDVQIKHPDGSGTKKVYFIAISGQEKKSIAEITLKYQSYELTVDPKGSVTSAGFNPVIEMNNGTHTGTWTHTGAYSAPASNWPKSATATGYEFKGFWTAKQPTKGNAGVNASEATFAAPVDKTTFEEYCTKVKDTDGDEYVTVDGKEYYNAGRKWDPSTDKAISGNIAFHAWWVPKDIVVKFYDVDGKFLGSKTTKYGSKPDGNWYPDPKDYYNAGAYNYQGFAYQWRDITGAVITENVTKFDKDGLKGVYEENQKITLTLTPIYTDKTYSDKYQVNFVDPATSSYIDGNDENNGIASGKYDYRHILSGENIPTEITNPNALNNDPGYSYEFAGWTTQKPASGNYHKVAKDDTTITENTDWVVRDEITYYAIFRSTVKEYLVNFNYTDSTGAAKTESLVVPYGSAIATPSVVNRTYATGGYGHTLEGWDYKDNTNTVKMLGADATLVFDNTKVFITTGNLAPSGTPIVFTANYDEGQPTPYTVTFKFKDATGKDKVITDEVYHGFAITQDTVDRVTVPAQYDDGTALYTFSNLWKVTEGAADKAEYTKDEFTSFKPVSHVTFEALYGEGVPFYTVKYIDGANTYEERVLAGNNVPAWLVKADGVETEYAPSKADTETGKYNFEGWFDAKQADEDFAETNGTEYTTASIVNGDLVLYPQFKFEPFKFTIKFMNFDGTVQLAAAEVEAGKSFEAAFIEAQRAAQFRDADETYSYKFIGWDYKVPDNFLCEGKDMTYTALYQPIYVYYEANWYNDASMSGDPLATTKHTYNSSVYAPAVKLTLPEAETGKTTVFAGWKYLKDGVETDYVRGMKITAGMNFYATYDYVNKAVTLTTVVGTVETEYSIEYNKKANIGNPADGYVDATNHNKFVGWYTDAAYENAFDMANTALTADTTIYAKFETAAHSKTMKELVSAPTYYATGSEIIWCACNREETDITVEIPMLTDTKAPTGTIYLGGHSWSSTGTPAYTTDNDPISIFVNADADIVITSNDTGDVNTAYNPSGIGKGIAKIRAFAFPANTVLTADNYGAARSLAVDVYTNNTQDLNNNANFSIKVGDIFVADLTEDGKVQYDDKGNVKYKALVDGESYIIYYYVNDKSTTANGAAADTGNQLNRLVRTAKFTYDNTPAEITVSGDCNAATATYCGNAVIKGIENGSTVLVNGEEVALTTSGAAGTSHYTITEAGNYVITVIDKAGNTSSKKIIVADGHDEITTSKDVTCTEDGYEKVICAVCGKVLKNETIKSEGHKYSAEVTVDPTCTEDGYTVKTCSVCGDEVKTPGEAKTGHTYNMDADGNVIYVTVDPSTCKVKGKAEAKCTVCGEGKLEKELKVDTVNGHKYGATKVLKATCTQDGEEYQNCKYCYAKNTVKVLEKLNHVGTGTYTKVTTAPTCYAEGVETTYCKGCDVPMSTAPVAKIAHTLVLVKYESEADKSDDYPNGYMQYECKATGCTHTEGKTAIAVKAEYTVTFVGAGVDGKDVVITKTEGESIEADAVADQTKASDNEYDYTFKGWKAESTDKIVKLPVKVTKNETYTAEFTATKRVYTHTFKINEDDDTTFATIVGTYNSANKKPAAIPTKAATTEKTFEFAGWVKVGDTTGAIVEEFDMTEDATFTAKFDEKDITYKVIYMYGTDVLKVFTVSGGGEVPAYETSILKDYDSNNHYVFNNKWSIEAGTKVYADTYIQPVFDAIPHSYGAGVETKAPTCTKTGVMTYACDCGKTRTETIAATGVHNRDDNGICVDCGHSDAVKLVTITFKGVNGTIYSESVKPGTTVTYDTVPTKDSTAKYEYTFKGWKVLGAEDSTATKKTEFVVDSDITYIAVFTDTVRTYTITYYNGGLAVKQFFGVQYGAYISRYDAIPTKAYNDIEHYDFSGWSINNGPTYDIDRIATEIVRGDTAIYAKYDTVKHVLGEPIPGTCSKPAHQKCTGCAYEYEIPGASSVAHTPDESTIVVNDSTFDATGTKSYYCTSCKTNVTETIPVKAFYYINIKVWNDDGNLAQYANVKLKHNGEFYDYYADGKETVDGFVSFKVDKNLDKKLWIAYIVSDGIPGGISGDVKTASNAETNINEFNKPTADDEQKPDEPKPEEPDTPDCTCSCHKDTFWGMIFRFFQKIIKLFGGKDCCADARK